jgi:hypothetical protein
MLYFGREVLGGMTFVSREPERLLFSRPEGDLIVRVDAGRPNTVSVITADWHAQARDFLERRVDSADAAIHYETESDHSPEELLQRAREYFGGTGLGLTLAAQGPETLEFAGGGGNVTVSVHHNGRAQVQIASRRWNYHAEQFARQVTSER